MKRELLLDERFDGPAGSPPDPAVWWATPWDSDSEDDLETSLRTENVFLDGHGRLVLRLQPQSEGRPWSGARVQTFEEGDWPPERVLKQLEPPCRLQFSARMCKTSPGVWEWLGAQSTTTGPFPDTVELDLQERRGAVPDTLACHVHGPAEWGGRIDLLSVAGIDASERFLHYWTEYRQDGPGRFGVTVPGGETVIVGESPPVDVGPIAPRMAILAGPPGSWGGEGGPPEPREYRLLVSSVKAWRL